MNRQLFFSLPYFSFCTSIFVLWFPHFSLFHLPQSDVSLWKMKLHEEITDKLTRTVLATVRNSRHFSFHMLSPSFWIIIHMLRITKSCTWSWGTEQLNSQPGAWLINQLITYLQPYTSCGTLPFLQTLCITLNCSLHLALLQEIPYLNRPPYRFYMQPLFKLNIRFCGQTSPSFRSLCSLQMNFILPKFYTQY